MPSFTLPNTPFPTGTSVSAYDAAGYSTFPSIPPGKPIDTATVTGGSLIFTGLTDGVSYFAAAKLSSGWKAIRFNVGADGPPPGIPEDISYAGLSAGQALAVNETGDGYEFVDVGTQAELDAALGAKTLASLADVSVSGIDEGDQLSYDGADFTGRPRTIIDSNDWDSPQDAIGRADEKGGALVQLPASVSSIDLATPLLIPDYVHLEGQGIRTTLRCTSTNYAVKFEGDHASVKNLRVEAQTKQASGGGFDYTKAGGNIELDRIIFGHKLKVGVLLAPEAPGAVYRLNRLRWDGVLESGTAIQLGDGTHLITDLYMSQIVGTGNSTADMLEWLKINSAVDTLKMSDSLFITGMAGIVGNGHPTNLKFRGVTTDNVNGIGWNFTGGGWEIECAGCEASASTGEGLNIGKEMRIFRWIGGAVQNGQANGAIIRAGAQDVTITGAAICDNNQSNGANYHGIFVTKNTSDFTITDNTIGNGRRVTEAGHQKRPVFVEKGTSDRYVISHNRFVGNEIAEMKDEGEGVKKLVDRNIET